MQLLLPAVLNAVRTTGGRWYALKQSHHRIYSYDWYNPLWSPFLEQIPISDCRFRIRRLWVVRYPIKSLSNLIKCPLNTHQIPLNLIKSPSNPVKTPWKSPDFIPNPQILLNQNDSTPCSARSPRSPPPQRTQRPCATEGQVTSQPFSARPSALERPEGSKICGIHGIIVVIYGLSMEL